VLRAVGARLGHLRRADVDVGRFSGDEFVIVTEVADPSHATRLAVAVDELLSRTIAVEDLDLVVTASIGIALGSRPTSATELLRDASIAMERAKHLGRGRHETFDIGRHDLLLARFHTENELRRAVDRDELRLHYQPVIDLFDGRMRAVEALCRWQHPARGLLAPAEFVPLAEDTGLINEIGAWTFEEACRQVRRWHDSESGGVGPIDVAVNVSARQLSDPKLVHLLAATLERTQADPTRLIVEVTETAVMRDPENALAALRALKRVGVRVAIDDFGTGYSSLVYLKRFPVDSIKIDRTFVAGLPANAEDAAIVASIVGLAKAVGVTTVAEGIETEAQLAACRDLGCDHGQGFLWSPAVPASIVGRRPRQRRFVAPQALAVTASP
jgi:EAL domain-containing protein (putative c-di-GMP-specific phosphodiesterase class I)